MNKILDIKNIVEKTNLKHVAIIMDGNRRWAKEKKLPSMFGHQKGVEALKNTLRACSDFGIKYLTVYAFSTENWKRTPDEVNFLMELLAKTLTNELDEMHKEGVKIRFIGDISALSDKLQKTLFKENYTPITYKQVHSFFYKLKGSDVLSENESKYLDDFLEGLAIHTKEIDNSFEEEMKNRFFKKIKV